MFTFLEMIVHIPYLCPVNSIVKAGLYCCCLHEQVFSTKNFASSAKSFMHAVITSGRSFIYIRNNIGPNTLPCGIPLVTLAE